MKPIPSVTPVSIVTGDDLRWLWTVVGSVATATGLVAFILMMWFAREADRDEWAVAQVHTNPLTLHRIAARSYVIESRFLAAATGVTAGIAIAMFAAGVAAIFDKAVLALICLVLSEILLVVNLLIKATLGAVKLRQRDRLRLMVRLATTGITLNSEEV